MKTFNHLFLSAILTGAITLTSCSSAQKENSEEQNTSNNNTEEATVAAGQSAVQDDESQKDVVKIAVGSKDHTTLVAAVKAGELVDVLSNAGPFTVFAPTNAAFDKLPKGTVEELLKPEKKGDLQDILQYHVTVSTYQVENLRDGQTLGMVNGSNATITVKDGKASINGANIVASVKASNGIVHVIDGVLLPPAGK